MTPEEALNPENWNNAQRNNYERILIKYKRYVRMAKFERFEVGQKVLVQKDIVRDKQQPKYERGGIIVEIGENDTYSVKFRGLTSKKHASGLRGDI